MSFRVQIAHGIKRALESKQINQWWTSKLKRTVSMASLFSYELNGGMVDGFRIVRIVLLTAIFTSLWSFALSAKAQEVSYPQPFEVSSAPPFGEAMNDIAGEAVRVLIRAVTNKIDPSEGAMNFVLLPYEEGQQDLRSLSFKGHFTGVTSEDIVGFESKQLQLDTTFTIHTQTANDKEVKIDVVADGKILSATDFIQFFPAVAMPSCVEAADSIKDQGLQNYSLNLCNSLDANKLSGSPSQIAAQMLSNWKNTLLQQLQNAYEQNSETFKGVYEEVISVVDQGIVVTEDPGATTIELHLRDLNEKLAKHFPDFFDKTKLDIIFIDTFRLTITDELVAFNFNLSIFQRQDRVSVGMGLMNTVYNNTPSAKKAGYLIGLGAAEFLEKKGVITKNNLGFFEKASGRIGVGGAEAAKDSVNAAKDLYNNALDALTGGGSGD